MPVILVTQEVVIRRIEVQSQTTSKVLTPVKFPFPKYQTDNLPLSNQPKISQNHIEKENHILTSLPTFL
jgi:hypothetical protein